MSATLDFLSGSIRGRSIDVGDRSLLIGRDGTCQVVLAETKVSREHARIVLEKADYFLEDLNSTNGTFVNGNPVNRRRQLHHNDQIHFADVLCVFRTIRDDDSASSFEDFQATLSLTMESAEQLPEILNAVNSGSDSKIDVNAHAKLRAVLEMIRRLGNSLQVDTLLANLLEGFFAVFPQTERGYVLFPEGPQGKLNMRATRQRIDGGTHTVALNLKLAKHAIATGQAILAGDDSPAKSESVLDSSLHSMMCIPLTGPQRKQLGAVYLETNDAATRFTEDDLRVLVSMAQIAGQAVEYAHEHEAMSHAHEQFTAELQRSNTELQQFAYAASHDLQEPLRAVAGYCQLLQEIYQGKLDEQADEFIERAVSGTKRMQMLITGLLEYSRVTTRAKEFAETDCDEVLAHAMANLEVAIHETGAVIDCGKMPMVQGDASQLTQLFQNLIGNAIKYRKPEETPRVQITAKSRRGEWEFSVRDNGIGIDPSFSSRVFEVFQRLHGQESYSGAGIGLAICKKVVERHRGRIWFESTLGQGCRFYFTLPR